MKNETKLSKVYDWLKQNGFNPHICKKYRKKKSADFTALAFKVANYHNVEIKIESDNDSEWFESHKRYNPIFIRKGEAPKFILEKVQNVIIKIMTKQQENSLLTDAQRTRKRKRRLKWLAKRHEKLNQQFIQV